MHTGLIYGLVNDLAYLLTYLRYHVHKKVTDTELNDGKDHKSCNMYQFQMKTRQIRPMISNDVYIMKVTEIHFDGKVMTLEFVVRNIKNNEKYVRGRMFLLDFKLGLAFCRYLRKRHQIKIFKLIYFEADTFI